MESQVEGMLRMSLENIKNLIDVNTVVGNPIITNSQTVIPISKVKLGFASGGTDFKAVKNEANPFGGGTGGAINIIPVAFLVLTEDDVKVLHLANNTHIYEKIIDKIPNVSKNKESQ